MSVAVSLLGEVTATVDGVPVDPGPARQRCVLVALLVDAGAAVTADELVERVWGDAPPVRALGTLRSYLSRLRGALGGRIDNTPFGYVCRVDRASVDLHRFRDLVARARAADDEQAADLFDTAFALWHGEPFATLDSPWLTRVRAVLAEEWRTARLDHVDVELRLGRHTRLLAGLADDVAAHPLDERLAGQYLLALYRSGQQAAALEHYHRFQRRLADELGVDPGPALRELHGRLGASEPERPVPRQLPLAPRTFTARDKELAELTTALARGGVVTVVGQGGAGKTWLALRWAHEHAGSFPDGQLYADLRGWSGDGVPVEPGAVVRGFLDALGVPAAAVPADPDARVALYRNLVADKRVLVLLDNARDSAQVADLLPGGTSSVVVTSRDRMADLPGAHTCPLDVLPDHEAECLLAGHLGHERLAADPGATAALLSVAGGLPLALGVLAAQLTVRPELGVRWLADELHDIGARLDVLDDGDLVNGLRAVIATSLTALRPDAARAFRALGLVDLPDVTVPAAAALFGVSASAARSLLRALESAHLLQQYVPGRYRMHDLVRLYSAELGHDDAQAARRGLVDFHVHTALAADRLLDPHRPTVEPMPVDPALALPHEDLEAALRWFRDEHLCVLAVQRCAVEHGWHTEAWRLAWAVNTAQRRRGDWQENLAAWQVGVAAAQDEPARLAVAHRFVGLALVRLSRPREALEHLDRSLRLAEGLGDLRGQAHSHYALTQTLDAIGELDRALTHAARTHRIYEDLDAPVERAHSLNSLGWCHARLGDLAEAERLCARALELHRESGSALGIASSLDSLGYIADHAGRHEEATRYYRESAEVHERAGDVATLVEVLTRLGDALHASGRPADADRAWARAVELCRAQHRVDEADRIEQRRSGAGAEGERQHDQPDEGQEAADREQDGRAFEHESQC